MKPTVTRIESPALQKGWIMTQTWEHLLFAHWAIHPSVLRPLVPAELELDTYDGNAWLGIIPFLLTGVRIRRMPPVPFTTRFPEINVRTYVKRKGRAGIYFLSLDASNWLVTTIAKKWYRLPYYPASIHFRTSSDSIDFQSRRLTSPAAKGFSVSYRPDSDVFFAEKGSLEHWLTERYTLFCDCKTTRNMYSADVYHEPWKLQKAAVQYRENTLTEHLFPSAEHPGLFLYSRGVQSFVWPIRKTCGPEGGLPH